MVTSQIGMLGGVPLAQAADRLPTLYVPQVIWDSLQLPLREPQDSTGRKRWEKSLFMALPLPLRYSWLYVTLGEREFMER